MERFLSKYFKTIDYTEEFRKEQEKYIESLPEEQKEAIIEYTKNTNINNFLLASDKNTERNYSNEVHLIDKSINEALPLKHSLIVYRGMILTDPIQSRKTRTGHFRLFNYSGKYPGYTSTTLFEKITRLFQQDTDKGIIFEIHLPIGFKCLYIRPLSKFRYQEEVLLPRNTIISIEKFKGNNHVIAKAHTDTSYSPPSTITLI
jgi:hypothetical protein